MDEIQTLLPFEKKTPKILVKKQADTDNRYGCNPEKRETAELLDFSIINIDKPKGPTSHQVSDYVQKILHIDKSGHSGTLDPAVTGVLPVAIGRGTRIVQAILPAGKEYVCLMHIHDEFSHDKIKEMMKTFVGKIRQLPPIKSAIKRQWRFREIYYIKILEIKDKDVLFVVGCEAGTYIRKLCHDMGVALGSNAHMVQLKRTKAGPFTEEHLCTLQDLTDAYHYYKSEGNDIYIRHLLRPIEEAVGHLPKIWIFDTTVDSLTHGASLSMPGISKLHSGIETDQLVAIMTLKDELVALGTARHSSKKIMEQEHGVAVIVDKVFMKEGIYPKMIRKDPVAQSS